MEFHLFLYFVIWILGRVKIPSKGCSYNNPRKQDGIIWVSYYFTKDGIPSRCKLDTSFSQMGRVKILSKGCTYNNPRTQDGIIWLPHYFTKDGIPSLPSCCKLDTSFFQIGRVKIPS